MFFPFGVFENPQYEKAKGKIAAAVGTILFLSVEGIKEKILPLSAFSGLRGVVGNKGEFLKISVNSVLSGVVGSEQEKFRDMPKERAEMPSCTVLLAERTGAGERRSFSEQDSTEVPKFALRSFLPLRESCWGVPSPNPASPALPLGLRPYRARKEVTDHAKEI